LKYKREQNKKKTMLKLGLSEKAHVLFDHNGGVPSVISTDRIIVGEIIEILCAQHISISDGFEIYERLPSFANCVQPNEIKLRELNQKTDDLYKSLLADLMTNGDPSQEEIEKLREHPELLSFFNSYKWLDMLIGNIPYYHITDLPNARIVWNTDSNVWNVVATTEILSGKTITLPIKK
jgi:hypothetical protein